MDRGEDMQGEREGGRRETCLSLQLFIQLFDFDPQCCYLCEGGREREREGGREGEREEEKE